MVIAVSAVVAYQSPDQIVGAVRAAIVRWAPRAVLLDVADVNALDAAGITALLASHQTGEWAGIPVSLINVGPFLLGQLRETGLASLLCPDPPPRDAAAHDDPGGPPASGTIAPAGDPAPDDGAGRAAPSARRGDAGDEQGEHRAVGGTDDPAALHQWLDRLHTAAHGPGHRLSASGIGLSR